MTTTVSFKDKYPLSPKKFWKKMLASIIPAAFLVFVFSIMIGGAIVAMVVASKSRAVTPALIVGLWLIGIVIFLLIIMALYAWYWRVYIRTYFYDAGDGYLTIRKGAITPAEIHVMYQKIQDVYVDQDLLDRFMGLYDVHIASATATSGLEAHIDGVDAATADALKNFLLSSINHAPTQTSTSTTPSSIPSAHIEVPANISSESYPISPRWIFSIIAGSLLSTIILILVFGTQMVSFLSHGASSGAYVYIFGGYFLLFCFIFGAQIVGSLLWKANFSWVFTPSFLEIRTGIINKSETHMPYSSIQDVLLKQGMMERLFGLCTVTIQNAAQNNSGYQRKGSQSGTNLPGQPLAKGQELVEIVRKMSGQGSAGRL